MLARIKSYFTWSRLAAIMLAYYTLGSMYSAGTTLWGLLRFVSDSYPAQAQVVDMRRKEVTSWVELLNTGEPLLNGAAKYHPIIRYSAPTKASNTSSPVNPVHSCELLEARSEPYEMGEVLPIRVHAENPLVSKESHGLFLWGASLLRLLLCSMLLFIAYKLFRRSPSKRRRPSKTAASTDTLLQYKQQLQGAGVAQAQAPPQQQQFDFVGEEPPAKAKKNSSKARAKRSASKSPADKSTAASKPVAKKTRAKKAPTPKEDIGTSAGACAESKPKKPRSPRKPRAKKEA